jgi:hypothetical protein
MQPDLLWLLRREYPLPELFRRLLEEEDWEITLEYADAVLRRALHFAFEWEIMGVIRRPPDFTRQNGSARRTLRRRHPIS